MAFSILHNSPFHAELASILHQAQLHHSNLNKDLFLLRPCSSSHITPFQTKKWVFKRIPTLVVLEIRLQKAILEHYSSKYNNGVL